MKLLNGLKVLEFAGGIKAGYCGKLFADSGADVTRVELPGAEANARLSAWLDPGKGNVVVDWRVAECAALVRSLAENSDVAISDCEEPETREALQKLLGGLPSLVVLSLSDLGEDGPFAKVPATDLVVSALSGMCGINGVAGRLPLREPGNQTAIVAALAGYLGALAAVNNRGQTGGGQRVDVSALEAMVNVLSPSIVQSSYQRGGPARRPKADGFLFECADGKVSIIISSERSWETIVGLWGLEIGRDDARLGTEGARRVNMDAVRELLAPVLMSKSRRELFEELCAVRIPCGMLLNPGELPADPHLVARESFTSVTVADGHGVVVVPGPTFRIARSSPQTRKRVARTGEDTARVLAPLAAGAQA